MSSLRESDGRRIRERVGNVTRTISEINGCTSSNNKLEVSRNPSPKATVKGKDMMVLVPRLSSTPPTTNALVMIVQADWM